MMKIVAIFKSPRKDETYLYVDKREQLERVPKPLLEMFGKPIPMMEMPMLPGRKLARIESAEKLLEEISANGYFLQLPPPKEDYMLDLFKDRPQAGVR